ncbi:serine protein kinase RIO [Ornithinimicrobium sufpigmenti]|uniref:serine protein kinase RIO n=1 Tax=Ornithinimicrobium sufpigmenti TaxID=2508882 RepID=UPI001035CE45|nr:MULTISPECIES: RIO1 family regulatory kinase/ATPase [unclassified Ornithinimicrobium]
MPYVQPPPPTGDLDPFFTFDYVPVDAPETATGDRRPTTYWSVDRSSRGPGPVPDWLVLDAGAVDTELGVLKTGKEADVHLLERAAEHVTPVESCLLAAKRYRDPEHTSFRRSSLYVEGRGVRRSRDQRALERRSAYGRQVAAGRWAAAEWAALCTAWSAGVAVPYPVSVQDTELLMEFVGGPDGHAAPRLAETRPGPELLEHCWQQVRAIVLGLAGLGLAHGDLSPYNLLLHGEVVLVIDLPQVVDVVANPRGPELLHRDCVNAARWFISRGHPADADVLLAEAVSLAL